MNTTGHTSTSTHTTHTTTSTASTAYHTINAALKKVEEMNTLATDGKWLEVVTVESACYIKDWDIAQCWHWDKWPDRQKHFAHTTRSDVGIDAVAIRRSDGKHIAIQCKSRQLDDMGCGHSIASGEVASFAAASAGNLWAERWIVTNGNNRLASGAEQSASMHDTPLKIVNIANDLREQHQVETQRIETQAYEAATQPHELATQPHELATQPHELATHATPAHKLGTPGTHATSAHETEPHVMQTKSQMQTEAVGTAVRLLKQHERTSSGGSPVGEARGRIILPCGTGKTRISLRIIEQLTSPNELALVLCPSIALVAQIRREYLQHSTARLDILAVCSDASAGYNPKKEDKRNTAIDPTVDNSNVSAQEVKGKVTTEVSAITAWMLSTQEAGSTSGHSAVAGNASRQGTEAGSVKADGSVKVLIGTYQSSIKVSEALLKADVKARVLIADEAHRTAGLKRRKSKTTAASKAEKRVRDFTVCHDSARFPVTYRVYQTATPRIYDGKRVTGNPNWIVRSMDDETTFGVELYRKSYLEAVRNRWLSDYRIIAMGINDPEAFETANSLAKHTRSKGRGKLTTSNYLRGLAFALTMGGATAADKVNSNDATAADRVNGAAATAADKVNIKSCIAFMNTVDKSKNMAADLQTDSVKRWIAKWLQENMDGEAARDYTLEHLDASSNAAARETAKGRLASAGEQSPHGILNVGIFGEGTDSPSLSAVAFLEARKSPIDVVQAVGRAMRTAPGKQLGYIICPILFPPTADPEQWLSNSNSEEGWQELGQVLLALRAHDSRIEDSLGELLQLYIPKPPPVERTLVAVASEETKRIRYGEVQGPPGAAQRSVEKALQGHTLKASGIQRIRKTEPNNQAAATAGDTAGSLSGGTNILSGVANNPNDTPVTATNKPPPPLSDRLLNAVHEHTTHVEHATPCRRTPPLEHTTPLNQTTPYEFTQIITGKKNQDGSLELRADSVARERTKPGEARGVVNIEKTKAKARKMINNSEGGMRLRPGKHRRSSATAAARRDSNMQQLLNLDGLSDYGNAIKMNLLTKSGLSDNRVARDLNILEASVSEAARHIRSDDLLPSLNRYFGLDRLKKSVGKQADGCTIAALLMMNAAMLHQRISNGRWLSGIDDLQRLKNDVSIVQQVCRQWKRIMCHDFRPVFKPALDVIYDMDSTGKTSGLERALRHLAAEAERIAETYADMGADHAGPLFNRVMGNQASDGAFFTRPTAASLAARLTLDACEKLYACENTPVDWSDPKVLRAHKTIDIACGSGTLLAAILTDMKRRAAAFKRKQLNTQDANKTEHNTDTQETATQKAATNTQEPKKEAATQTQNADEEAEAMANALTNLQKIAVEDVIKGLDINPVSLQLAASQLTAGNQHVSYRRMGLHQMPYGPDKHDADKVSAGSLELLTQSSIVRKRNQLDLGDDTIRSRTTWTPTGYETGHEDSEADIENAVDAAQNARIVIMNPPFTNRVKMGEKFTSEIQHKLRARVDATERALTNTDTAMHNVVDKNSVRALFVGLADHCLNTQKGVLTMVQPTIALVAPSGLKERLMLAQRYHIHTILTSHEPGNVNMSQNSGINESIVVAERHTTGDKPATRIVNLDRMPVNDDEVADFHRHLQNCDEGLIANGWGEVSYWPSEHIEQGDWTASVWRSPQLATAAMRFENDLTMRPLKDMTHYHVRDSGRRVSENFTKISDYNTAANSETAHTAAIPVLHSAGAGSQQTINSSPDSFYRYKRGRERQADHYMKWASHLLLASIQDTSSARLTAVASATRYLGGSGWMSVEGIPVEEAKAVAVFMNSTPGRLQLMRNFGKKLAFRSYSPSGVGNVRIPDMQNRYTLEVLSACWERTQTMRVPQFRDGECDVRTMWDEAVCEAMGWNANEIAELRSLLHKEPHVRGLGYGQYA